ncbi:hypothetical protein C7330_4088 [Pectobacterium versatile]|nr:hypothetical protein C7330_4088 [Pectobacterium versatile]
MAMIFYHITEGIMKSSNSDKNTQNASKHPEIINTEIRQILTIEHGYGFNKQIGRGSLLKSIANLHSGRDTRR